MLKSTQIVMIGASWLVMMSLLYFLVLLLGLPVWAFLLLIAAGSVVWIKYSRRQLLPVLTENYTDRRFKWIPVSLLAIALFIIVYKVTNLHEKYGAWDAWWFWNVRANLLTKPEHWLRAFSGEQYGTLFTVPVAHSDYPPFLPLAIAGIWRVLGSQPNEVPYLLTLAPALSISSVIFWEMYEKRKWVAIGAMLFFILNQHMLLLHSYQTGDVWVAFFLLLTIINLNYFNNTNDRKGLLWAGFFMGACCWVKNEGMIISFVLLIVYLNRILKHNGWKSLIAGAVIPLCAFLLFKVFLAPTNDMIADHDGKIWAKIIDKERYVTIWSILKEQTQNFYPELPYLLGGYLVVSIYLKTFPGRDLIALILIFLAYLLIFLLSPHNLGWHVSTSLDRLLFQLLPSLIWVLATKLCLVKWPLKKQIR